jgi:hypothetical protein
MASAELVRQQREKSGISAEPPALQDAKDSVYRAATNGWAVSVDDPAAQQEKPCMPSILVHHSHPENAEGPITGVAFSIEYGEGKKVRFADLAIPPSSDASSLGAFRQELRRLATAILDVASSGTDIHWDRSDR